jgi:hypothetical protein
MKTSPHYLIGQLRGYLSSDLLTAEQTLGYLRLALAEYDEARKDEARKRAALTTFNTKE